MALSRALPLLCLSGVLGALPIPSVRAGRPSSVVVLDPGHGGTNTGAFGPYIGLHEKELTLRLALRVARYFRMWHPGAEVVLTRTRDEYLTLDQRVRKANGVTADLFVSLHFNACKSRTQRGFETFLLTWQASDREATRRLSAGSRGRSSEFRRNVVVGAILSDLRQTAAHGESVLLARLVQRRLAEVWGPGRDRGVRQAPFDVLMGLQMPGVLVEAGFIDHPLESRALIQEATFEAVAAAVAAAVSDHLATRRQGLASRISRR